MFYHRFGPSIYAWESYDEMDTRRKVFVTEFFYNGTKYEFLASDNGFYPEEKKIGCQQLQEMLNFMIIRQVRN